MRGGRHAARPALVLEPERPAVRVLALAGHGLGTHQGGVDHVGKPVTQLARLLSQGEHVFAGYDRGRTDRARRARRALACHERPANERFHRHPSVHEYLQGASFPIVANGFTHDLRVRYGECDPQGVVFNAHYFAYFDIALTELWRDAVPGGYAAMTGGGVDMVVAEARARFHSPAHFDDELAIEVAVTRLGTTGLTTAIGVRRGADLLVTGEMRHVFVDLGTHAKTPIPAAVRAGLERYAAPADPAAA